MKYKFKVPSHELNAALRFARSSKPVANGVHFEAAGDRLLIVATDAIVLVIICSTAKIKNIKGMCFTAPSTIFEDGLLNGDTAIEYDAKTNCVKVLHTVAAAKGFPEWRKILPNSIRNTDRIELNSKILCNLSASAKDLGSEFHECPQLVFDGCDSPVKIFFEDLPNFYGLIMPCQIIKKIEQPEWLCENANAAKISG